VHEGPGRYDFFRYEDCDLCGDCLVRCQYMDLTRAEAIEEMKRLIASEPTRMVHDKCISCYACDAFCPHDCRPYELILKSWHQRYRKKGLPVRASYLMPASSPNFRTDIVKRLNVREKELLRLWGETPPEGEVVLYPGCSALTLPHLLDAGFMQGVKISGDFDLCCGEMYFRQGLFDVVERVAEKLTTYYRGRDIGTMLFVCPAGLNMFRNVLPQQFGAEFDFAKEYIGTWLLDRVESGEIEIVKKLQRSVAVHDSCHARILGGEVMDTARSLYSLMGLEMREMEHSREEGYCCGFAAGCNRYSPVDMVLASIKELWESQRTGAKEMAVYCTACLTTMTMYRWLFPTIQPLRHLLEYLKEATGETPCHPAQRRSLRMLSNIALKAFPQIPSKKTYRIEIP
jgi:Fe-S oxidoreductase